MISKLKARFTNRTKNTRDLVGIVTITKDILVLRQGKYRAIIKVGSTNTDLMTDYEQQVFDQKFGMLINSLNFPIQLLVKSKRSEVFPYLHQLEKAQAYKSNGKYRNYITDHYHFAKEMVRVHQAVERPKWIVVPWDAHESTELRGYDSHELYTNMNTKINEKELLQAQEQLGNRCDLVFQNLRKMQLPYSRLEYKELVELCFDSFNPSQAGTVSQLQSQNIIASLAVEGIDFDEQ